MLVNLLRGKFVDIRPHVPMGYGPQTPYIYSMTSRLCDLHSSRSLGPLLTNIMDLYPMHVSLWCILIFTLNVNALPPPWLVLLNITVAA